MQPRPIYLLVTGSILLLASFPAKAQDAWNELIPCLEEDFAARLASPPTNIPVQHIELHPVGASTPERVDLEASHQLGVIVTKPDASAWIRVRLVATPKHDSGAPSTCRWQSAQGFPPRLSMPNLSPGVYQWQVEVLDSNAGGPTGDAPYSPTIDFSDAGSLLRPSQFEPQVDRPLLFDPSTAAIPDPIPECKSTIQPLRSQAVFEPATGGDGIVDAFSNPSVTHFAGGRRVYLKIGSAKHVPFSGVLYAKRFLYRPICAFGGDGLEEDGYYYFSAELDWAFLPTPITWRVDVTSRQTGQLPSLQILRERAALSNPAAPQIVDEYVCNQGLGTRGAFRTDGPTDFSGHSAFSIRVQSIDELSSASLTALEDAIVSAFSIWRHACTTCSTYNMSILRINERTFVLNDLYAALKREMGGDQQRSPFSQFAPPGFDSSKLPAQLFVDSRTGARAPAAVHYVEVPKEDVVLKYACDTPIAGLSEEMVTWRNTNPCETAIEQQGGPILLLFQESTPACGNESDVVACEADYRRIEFNAKQFAYLDDFTRRRIVGSGELALALFPILLHEVGHWAGLGHVDAPDSIMNSYDQDIRCIDKEVVRQLAEISANKLKPVAGHTALRYRGLARSAE